MSSSLVLSKNDPGTRILMFIFSFNTDEEKCAALILSNHYSIKSTKKIINIFSSGDKKRLDNEVEKYLQGSVNFSDFINDETLSVHWDSSEFIIKVRGEDAIADLYSLHQIFIDGKMLSGKFSKRLSLSAGPIFVHSDSLNEQEKDTVRESHIDHNNLIQEFNNSGIKDKIKNAGLSYYSLKPKWGNKSKTVLKFWLNPHQQQKYNYGWMTLQDLHDWCDGCGKIVKECIAD